MRTECEKTASILTWRFLGIFWGLPTTQDAALETVRSSKMPSFDIRTSFAGDFLGYVATLLKE